MACFVPAELLGCLEDKAIEDVKGRPPLSGMSHMPKIPHGVSPLAMV